jgi:hypothetical protein
MQIHRVDEYLYIADGPAGLRIVSVADPRNAVYVGGVVIDGYLGGIEVQGEYTYITDIAVDGSSIYTSAGDERLKVFDGMNLKEPELLAVLDTPGYVRKMYLDGSNAYVADEEGDLRIISLDDPTDPEEAGSFATPGAVAWCCCRSSWPWASSSPEPIFTASCERSGNEQ